MKTFKITNQQLQILLDAEAVEFPKYATQILNLANQNAGGTRPKIVGQLSELIHQFPDDSLEDWRKWYLEKHPEAIEAATEKIYAMILNLRQSIDQIDKPMVEKWVRDLVFTKTFIGLRFQAAILKRVAEQCGQNFSLSSPQEEARGIDGYIGERPVSIKPETYKTQSRLGENIEVDFIFYTKLKDGLRLEYDFD